MKVSEIKVSYSNRNNIKVKVTNSKIIYNLIMKHWNLDIIEYQEEVKIILLNRANIVLGIKLKLSSLFEHLKIFCSIFDYVRGLISEYLASKVSEDLLKP